jgi:hypothetical protein
MAMGKRDRPADITVLSLLFMLLAWLCVLCGLGLLVPADEPHPFLEMFPALTIMGTNAVSWLVFVALASIAAAAGLWRSAYWGFVTGSVVLVLFLAMHFVRALFTQRWWEIALILAMAAVLWAYLRTRAHLFVHETLSHPGRDLPEE